MLEYVRGDGMDGTIWDISPKFEHSKKKHNLQPKMWVSGKKWEKMGKMLLHPFMVHLRSVD